METHRVMHDFGELSYEDLGEINRRSVARIPRPKSYSFLFAAIALGLFVGFLARRK
jgi:hypothetical protein